MKHFIFYALFLLVLTGSLSACATSSESESELSPMESPSIQEEAMPHDAMDAHDHEEEPMKDSTSNDSADLQSFTSENKYQSPGGLDTMSVRITVTQDGVVDSVSVSKEADNDGSRFYLSAFSDAVPAQVLGKKLQDIEALSTLAGASLSTKAFNIALADLQDQAS